jgi:hypothetical protein
MNSASWFWDTGALAWTRASGGAVAGPNVNVTNFPAAQVVSGTIDVTDRAARLLGHVAVDSHPPVDVTDRASRLLGVTDVSDRVARILGHIIIDSIPPVVIGLADSVMGAGTLATPGLGAAIATIPAPGAGIYEIKVTTFVAGPTQGTQVNMELRHGAVTVRANGLQSILNQPVSVTCNRITVAAAETITVNATAADVTAGVIYVASITATLVA